MSARRRTLSKGLAGIRRIIFVTAMLFSLLCSLSANGATVDPKSYGAYGDGVHNDTAAIQTAINSGNNVAFSAGTYLVHPTLTVNAVNGQTISGNGATLSCTGGSGSANILITISKNNCTINGLNFQFDGSVDFGIIPGGMGDTIENCLFQGSCPQYMNLSGSWNTTVTSNIFYGTGAPSAPSGVICCSVNGFTVTNNQFQDCGGFNVQTLWARNGIISGNVFRNPTYVSTVTAAKNQTVFTFTFPVAVIRCGLRMNNVVVGNQTAAEYTATSTDNKTWTVTLLATKATAGETVSFYGWRSLENINMNAGSAHITVTGNSLVGTGDSSIDFCSDYNINGVIVSTGQAEYPVYMTASNNQIRNAAAAGVAVILGVPVATTTNPWANLNSVEGWGNNNVVINSSGQLQVYTGSGQSGYWMPGQMALTQCSNYHLSWDQGNSGDWSFVQFNSLDTTGNMQCGFLVNGNAVQLFVNGLAVENTSSASPTGQNGLHHFDITVQNGQMNALIDGAILWNQSLTGVGTGTTGIGYFSVYSAADDAYGYLDNFEYQVIGNTSVVADNFNVTASSNPNSSLSTRQLGYNYWIDGNEIVDTSEMINKGNIPWCTCVFDSSDTNKTNGAYVSNNTGYCTVTNIPEYLFTCNTGSWCVALTPQTPPNDFYANYTGNLDFANSAGISGWAYDSTRPNIPLGVEIYADGNLIQQVRASNYRSDLYAEGYGNGNHGFDIAMPPSLYDGKNHTISVNIIDTQSAISSSPTNFTTGPPVSTASPVGGTYTGPVQVTLSANEPATIYYTLNGITPTTSSSVYTGPITITSSCTLEYFSVSSGGQAEQAINTQTYVIQWALGVNVTLQDFSGDFSLVPVRVDVRDAADTTTLLTQTVAPTGNNFTVSFIAPVPGSYLVRALACEWLSMSAPVTVTQGQSAQASVSLPNGDVNGDGCINQSDFNSWQPNYGQSGN